MPDTETVIRLSADGGRIEFNEGTSYILNPYDEYAVEEALAIKEKYGGEVIVYCIGQQGSEDILKKALAMGADSGVLFIDDTFSGKDPYYTAKILHMLLSKDSHDLILCGKKGIDYDYGITGGMTAELLGIPYISSITALSLYPDEKRCTAKRDAGYGTEVLESKLPAVISCGKGLNEPRLPSLKGIIAAKKKTIRIETKESLNISDSDIQEHIKITGYALPAKRDAGKIMSGDNPAQAAAGMAAFIKGKII